MTPIKLFFCKNDAMGFRLSTTRDSRHSQSMAKSSRSIVKRRSDAYVDMLLLSIETGFIGSRVIVEGITEC